MHTEINLIDDMEAQLVDAVAVADTHHERKHAEVSDWRGMCDGDAEGHQHLQN
jgi:hypothetical protein